jgi:CRISPR-associated protein Cas2
MHKIDFLICYDISDEKRLRKIARFLESTSIRIQKSIFFYPNCSRQEILKVSLKLEELINSNEDDIRIYNINKTKSINIKSAIDLEYPKILLGDIS